jgi:hypothetical protein
MYKANELSSENLAEFLDILRANSTANLKVTNCDLKISRYRVMRKPKIQLVQEAIAQKIFVIKSHNVILDADLALLYGVETKKLKQAVNRNRERFPPDFMIVLTQKEYSILRSKSEHMQIHGKHSKYLPYAFTEQGIAMLSSVLKSKQAVAINIQIMRVFVKMRQMVSLHKDLLEKIEKLEASHSRQNEDIGNIYNLIKELLEPSIKNRERIGFKISGK